MTLFNTVTAIILSTITTIMLSFSHLFYHSLSEYFPDWLAVPDSPESFARTPSESEPSAPARPESSFFPPHQDPFDLPGSSLEETVFERFVETRASSPLFREPSPPLLPPCEGYHCCDVEFSGGNDQRRLRHLAVSFDLFDVRIILSPSQAHSLYEEHADCTFYFWGASNDLSTLSQSGYRLPTLRQDLSHRFAGRSLFSQARLQSSVDWGRDAVSEVRLMHSLARLDQPEPLPGQPAPSACYHPSCPSNAPRPLATNPPPCESRSVSYHGRIFTVFVTGPPHSREFTVLQNGQSFVASNQKEACRRALNAL